MGRISDSVRIFPFPPHSLMNVKLSDHPVEVPWPCLGGPELPSRCLGPVWGALSFHSIQVWEAAGSLQAAFRWRLWEPGSQSAVPFGPWRFGFSQTSAARWGSYSWACAVCSAFSPPSQDRAMGVFSLSACASPQLRVGWLVLTNSVTCYLPSAKHIITTTGSHLFKKEKEAYLS